jgi:hypothetical protein
MHAAVAEPTTVRPPIVQVVHPASPLSPSCCVIVHRSAEAAEAVAARIDWKYMLGLGLTASSFDYSILSEFRDRLLHSRAEQ